MVIYKSHLDTCAIGPDYVRLKYRYEVLNGSSHVDDEVLKMRTLSYGMMLGKDPLVEEVMKQTNISISLPSWFDESTLL